MDTLTHTLFGWLLSRAGLERIGPWVPAVAMISANLPDVEECSHRFTTKVEYLQNYRGFSHSLAGAIGLSILAASCVWGVGRLLNKRIHQPPSFLWALLVCGIGILSHIFLDSLNSDGLRLLFPFTTDSYYGDLAFMMDPWMWLILGGSIFIGSRKSKWTRNIFLFLTATTTAVLFQAVNIGVISNKVFVIWILLLLLCFILHVSVVGSQRPAAPARWGLLLFSIYLAGLFSSHCICISRAYDALKESEPNALRGWQMSANPTPAVPWSFEIIAYSEKRVALFSVDLFNNSVERYPSINPRLDSPALSSCVESSEYKTWRSFARFPIVRETNAGLILSDMRYRIYTENRRFGNNDFSQWCDLTLPHPVVAPVP